MEESGVEEESVPQAPQRSKLLEKPNTKVTIWKYFGFQSNESGKIADMNQPICKRCLQKVLTKHSCTTNLYSHFKKYHPELYDGVKPQTSGGSATTCSGSQTITESFEKSQMLSTKCRELTNSVCRCIAKDMLPIYALLALVQKEFSALEEISLLTAEHV